MIEKIRSGIVLKIVTKYLMLSFDLALLPFIVFPFFNESSYNCNIAMISKNQKSKKSLNRNLHSTATKCRPLLSGVPSSASMVGVRRQFLHFVQCSFVLFFYYFYETFNASLHTLARTKLWVRWRTIKL